MARKRRKLTRSDDRILGGVAAGFAEYLDADPTLIRLILVLLVFVTAVIPMILFYLVAWAIMPER